MILVMAAGGNQGRILLPKLSAAGFGIRGFRASPGREDELKKLGATEVVSGNAADRASLEQALSGVKTVYHVGPTANEFERDMGFAMVDAVRKAGKGVHLIFSSVLHPISSKLVQHKIKRDIEEYLVESGANFTILQPSDYMLPGMLNSGFKTGVLAVPFWMNRPQAMIDLHDLSEVVVKIAREREKHYGAIYELSSPGAPSGQDLADASTKAAGKTIIPKQTTADEQFDKIFGPGKREVHRHTYAVFQALEIWYKQHDFIGNPNILEWLLGRPATTIEKFAEREWAAYQRKQKS